MEDNVYSLEEVSAHNHSRDCWLVIGGKVYDVTKFLEDHPGGDEVLLSATGKDATDDFEDVGHSTSARAMMDEYYVGEIDPSTFPSKPTFTPAKQAAYNPDKSSEFLIKILQFLVPLAILALAVAVRFLTKNEDVKNKSFGTFRQSICYSVRSSILIVEPEERKGKEFDESSVKTCKELKEIVLKIRRKLSKT